MDFLYRLLNSSDNPSSGLSAKNPSANTSIVDHVAYGSRGEISQYISTCSTYSAVRNLASICRDSTIRIVKIDINRLRTVSSANIIDLSTSYSRAQHFESSLHEDLEGYSRAINFAQRFSEVLIEGHIPSSCVQLIYEGSRGNLPPSDPS